MYLRMPAVLLHIYSVTVLPYYTSLQTLQFTYQRVKILTTEMLKKTIVRLCLHCQYQQHPPTLQLFSHTHHSTCPQGLTTNINRIYFPEGVGHIHIAVGETHPL